MTTNESAPTGDSELTAKAREVLAGLSDNLRAAWSFWADYGGDARLGSHHMIAQWWVERGMLSARTLNPTDLGREVARLLSEVQS